MSEEQITELTKRIEILQLQLSDFKKEMDLINDTIAIQNDSIRRLTDMIQERR